MSGKFFFIVLKHVFYMVWYSQLKAAIYAKVYHAIGLCVTFNIKFFVTSWTLFLLRLTGIMCNFFMLIDLTFWAINITTFLTIKCVLLNNVFFKILLIFAWKVTFVTFKVMFQHCMLIQILFYFCRHRGNFCMPMCAFL